MSMTLFDGVRQAAVVREKTSDVVPFCGVPVSPVAAGEGPAPAVAVIFRGAGRTGWGAGGRRGVSRFSPIKAFVSELSVW
jgi:hypothetical protein